MGSFSFTNSLISMQLSGVCSFSSNNLHHRQHQLLLPFSQPSSQRRLSRDPASADLAAPRQRRCGGLPALYAAGADVTNSVPQRNGTYTVGDFMTKKEALYVVKATTSVDEALEVLVEKRITGFPVIDDDWNLVGVVSDYDLLALDSISGSGHSDVNIFPDVDSSWKAFNRIQRLVSKTHGKVVGDLMTPAPLVVRETTNIEDAARLLLETKYRRLPVVDSKGKLVGLPSLWLSPIISELEIWNDDIILPQALLLPAATSAVLPSPVASGLLQSHKLIRLQPMPFKQTISPTPLSNLKPYQTSIFSSPYHGSNARESMLAVASSASPVASANDESDKAKLAQVVKRLESTSRYFKRLGNLGFWGQLVCTIVAAVILSFSVVITGKITSPATFYATAGGIAAAFISIFWSFGYIRLSERLRKNAADPSKAPPRADVVKSLKNGIVLNLLGMGAAILGMQATVGLLVAKALTSSANPFYQGISPGYSPVLALDVFLVQASANTILSHFLGLVFSLELLRSVTVPPSEAIPILRAV
ncbi:hypothetical protein SAY86_005238 [Trapa natans]|uniref:CBS domain-containing protein n=1 Tax=Trapa natans TaxID=22666 RepID=A0AAN7L0P0_TRANT|nr:hypothetical protein SAY86_005238 [Trapa natans]